MAMRGAALLITLLLVGILTTVLLGAGRLSIREVRSAKAFSDSTGAYFAAESGIEDGLFRYRQNHEVEQPSGASKSSTQGTRIDLFDNTNLGTQTISAGSFDPNHPIFDEKIWYRDTQIGSNLTDVSTFETIEKDGSRELSGFSPTSITQLTISAVASGPGTCLQVRVFSQSGSGNNNCFDIATSSSAPTSLSVPVGASERLLLRAIGGKISFAVRPQVGSPNQLFDSGITHIESTGFFGGVKRKLEAQIDRRSGTVIGLFDYTIYSGSGSI